MSKTFWKEPFLDMVHKVWSMPEEYWIDDSPRFTDTDLLQKNALSESEIDEVNYRADMVAKWKAGEAGVTLKVKELPGRTRLVFLGTEEQWAQIPWATWARIFQLVEHPIGHVLFYADPRTRVDPVQEGQLKAKDINGGYSYICSQELVVIYRFEEATRVLLHELLHTMCFDKEKGVENLEAHTEAWTELYLCALLSKGSSIKFNRLWRQQVHWIIEQATTLSQERGINRPVDYAWRYMRGKMDVLERMGFLRGYTAGIEKQPATQSLRFTTPEWDLEMN
jgi:hypothetical protein